MVTAGKMCSNGGNQWSKEIYVTGCEDRCHGDCRSSLDLKNYDALIKFA